MEHFFNSKFPTFLPPLIHNHFGVTTFTRKILCAVPYEENDPLEFGLILKTQKQGTHALQYYSIATGKLGEKNGIKYYEVYPELYNYKQAQIIHSVFKMIKWADAQDSIDETDSTISNKKNF